MAPRGVPRDKRAPSEDAVRRAREKATLGRAAEDLVAAKLARAGYAIVGRNVRVGRLELDVMARRGSLLVVVEVRARAHPQIAEPYESIRAEKIQRVRRATATWLASAKIGPVDVRFDVASVVFDQAEPRIQYFENAF